MKSHTLPKDVISLLLKEAKQGQKNAYAPYSKFQIGASVLSKDGQIFSGGNMENSSYGGTVCAERVAIWKAVSESAKLPLQAVYVISSSDEAWPPCGLCRQVMSEFCDDMTIVLAGNKKGEYKSYLFGDLLPEAFTKSYLKKKKSKK